MSERIPRQMGKAPADAHDARIKYVGVLPYGQCSCGWEGPTRDRDREAADDIRDHWRDLEPVAGTLDAVDDDGRVIDMKTSPEQLEGESES